MTLPETAGNAQIQGCIFSSRRRHTRYWRDWSSDVCSSDLIWVSHGEGSKIYDADGGEYVDLHGGYGVGAVGHGHPRIVERLEERRVGKECRSRRSPDPLKNKVESNV